MGGMTQPSMGRPNATQMQPMPSTYPGSQVSMSGPSFGGPANAGLTGLSGPTLGQAAPPSGASGAGMSHSGLPGGRRMYPGHAPPSPVENQQAAGSMGMPSHTVSLGSALACFKQIHVVLWEHGLIHPGYLTELHCTLSVSIKCVCISVAGPVNVSWCRIHDRDATHWSWSTWYGIPITHELSNATTEKN